MTNKTKPSKQLQAKYGAYKLKDSYKLNRIAKIEKHLKLHPNDEKAKAALKANPNIRKAPTNKLGWVQDSVRFFYGKEVPVVLRKKEAQDLAKVAKIISKANNIQLHNTPKVVEKTKKVK